MEGSADLDSVCTGDSVEEMGEGGRWWMVGSVCAACACLCVLYCWLKADEERVGADGRMSESLRVGSADGLRTGLEDEAVLLSLLCLAQGRSEVESSESSSFS